MKTKAKTKTIILPIVAAVVVIAAVLAIVIPRTSGDSADAVNAETTRKSAQSGTDIPVFTGNIEINESEITETAAFFDYDADSATVEVFAVRASDGTVRLALNTCQVCMGSPYAYFVQSGDSFICQNCNNSFNTDNIGIEKGGCNPVPITAEYYETTNGVITISSDFLEGYKNQFANWKSF
ncbi:MAG: DUF2318 domain-containing protein [Clostridiales bacterium]|nr:DUF2318 domain-containing protein [Clostridiales bacterium]MCD7828469.1 DUF2318 domain-containing protein [Clostridiales bacterium]